MYRIPKMAWPQFFVVTLLVCIISQSCGFEPVDHIIDIITDIVSGGLPSHSGNVTEPNFAYFDEYQVGPTINTTSGPVQGARLNAGFAFYSVPYAQPPERFQDPEPITEPLDFINATDIDGLACPQRLQECGNGVCVYNINEDCLILNVHVPDTVNLEDTDHSPNATKPVFVWFHGGGFFTGAATFPEFESRSLSNAIDSVIVTVNYRLNAFGFLVYGEGADGFRGNQGLKDQQLALQWVQDNIGQFGGDKTKVTIFGNSAGAQSVMFHMVSDISEPLFNRGIMQSNPAVFKYQTPQEALTSSEKLIRRLNCTAGNERQCLLDAPMQDIVNALPSIMAMSLVEDQDIFSTVEAFRPVIDGDEYKDQPLAMIRDGRWQSYKDLIVGTNTQELETIQVYIPAKLKITKNIFELINNIILGQELGPVVSEKYEAMVEQGTEDYRVILGVEASHMFFHCPSRALARFASQTSTADGNVYLYSNAHPLDGESCKEQFDPFSDVCGFAFHGSEVTFVFRSGPLYGMNFSDADQTVSNTFNNYWTNFADTGNPSDTTFAEFGTFASWPEYVSNDLRNTPRKRLYNYAVAGKSRFKKMNRNINSIFKVGIDPVVASWSNIRIQAPESSLEDGYLEEICDFWDGLNFYVEMKETTTPQMQDGPTTQSIASTVELEEQTTTGSATQFVPSFFLQIILLFSIKLIVVGRNQ